MQFKNFKLIIDSNIPSIDDIKKIIELGFIRVKDYGKGYDWYDVINIEFIDDRFLWVAIDYDNVNMYNEKVINIDNDLKENNPRKPSQVEMRYQLFICYDMEENILYITDDRKKGFVKHYIYGILQKEVTIGSIFSTIEDFQNNIKGIKNLKFTQIRNVSNSTPNSIFTQQANILGFDLPEKLVMTLDYGKSPVSIGKKVFQDIKQKRSQGEFEKIVLVGVDDENIEQAFDFSSMIQSIKINVNKNENNRYDEDIVKNEFLKEIR